MGSFGKDHKAGPGAEPLLQPFLLSLAQLTLNDGSFFGFLAIPIFMTI